ncbi:hypothetical protein KKC15_09780 [bacterium]|nr:hypothetical protein [bacterium]
MSSARDENNRINNMMYYNQVVRENSVKNTSLVVEEEEEPDSFTSQEIDFSRYITAPEGWEGVVYSAYFLLIPYIVGSIFLFLFIANGSIDNFMLLNMGAFYIVWAIGYEIVASIALVWIFILFIKYNNAAKKKSHKLY